MAKNHDPAFGEVIMYVIMALINVAGITGNDSCVGAW